MSIVSDNKVRTALKEMTRQIGERLTDEIARKVCERTGSKAVICGFIAGVGKRYVIGLNAINCASDDPIARE